MAEPSAQYFDGWYADMLGSPAKDELMQRHLGLPGHLLCTGLLSWDGIAEVVEVLQLSSGSRLLDLACGRGGYGLEIAGRTGAHVVGVDLSAEAVAQAQVAAAARQPPVGATFAVGDLASTGLPDASVDAVLCIDAIQFARDPAAAYREIRRVLVPGGRAALTCWEPLRQDPASLEAVPVRLRGVDPAAGLREAGFLDVVAQDRPEWLAVELSLAAEAASLHPGDDVALRSLHDESLRSLQLIPRVRRVLAAATAPGSAG